MIKIGIIGHGFMGHEHEAMLSQLEGYQLVGFSDRDRSVLEDVRPGLKRYESNEALLRDPEVVKPANPEREQLEVEEP